MTIEEIRKNRKKHTAEEFTPPDLVSEMLDKLPQEVWDDPTKTFIDPAGGNGNFVVEVLKRKLQKGHDTMQALSTVFSVELMGDNVEEMRQRLLDALPELDEPSKQRAKEIINHNIVCADALTFNYDKWEKPKRIKSKSLF